MAKKTLIKTKKTSVERQATLKRQAIQITARLTHISAMRGICSKIGDVIEEISNDSEEQMNGDARTVHQENRFKRDGRRLERYLRILSESTNAALRQKVEIHLPEKDSDECECD